MPPSAPEYIRLAEGLDALGEPALAEAVITKCTEKFPYDLNALLLLSHLQFKSGNFLGAWNACMQSTRIAGEHLAPHFNLVTVGNFLGCREEQIASHLRILDAHPENGEFHFLFAETLDRLGRFKESLRSYRIAAARSPDNAKFHIHLGYALLRLGHWEEGWREFAWYFQPEGLREFSPWGLETPKPLLQRGDSVEGKSLLVTGWGGLGDMVMFSRFCTLLRNRGVKRVTLHTSEPVFFSHKQDQFTASSEDLFKLLPTHDAWVPAAAVIHRLGLTQIDVQKTRPHLFANQHLCEVWKQNWANAPHRPRVGIAWSGNPSNLYEKTRSLAFADVASLLESNTLVDWYVIQKNARNSELKQLKLPHVFDYSDQFSTLEHLAALVVQLDLVVSVDSLPAHLSASLGTETCLLLGKCPDWRWEVHGESSIWYPCMTIFRQTERGDWRQVFRSIEARLQDLTDKYSRGKR
jgi:hypothetical protein